MKKKIKGFTIIEIIIVIGILVILSSVAVPSYINISEKAKETQCRDTRSIAIKQYYYYKAMGGTISPDGMTDFQFLIDTEYMEENTGCSKGGQYTWYVNENGFVYITCSAHSDEIFLYNGSFSEDSLGSMLGSWEIVDGSLYDLGNGEQRIIINGTNSDDYTIIANAQWQEYGWGGYGIYYRATEDASNISGYCFQFDPGLGNQFVVREVVNGNETSPIASVYMSDVMGDDFDLNAYHEIRVDVSGTSHEIYVDDVLVLSFEDDTFSEGSVGFRTWNTSDAVITDMQVIEN